MEVFLSMRRKRKRITTSLFFILSIFIIIAAMYSISLSTMLVTSVVILGVTVSILLKMWNYFIS